MISLNKCASKSICLSDDLCDMCLMYQDHWAFNLECRQTFDTPSRELSWDLELNATWFQSSKETVRIFEIWESVLSLSVIACSTFTLGPRSQAAARTAWLQWGVVLWDEWRFIRNKTDVNDKKSQGCRNARLASRLITSQKTDTIALLKQILLVQYN